MRYAFHQCPAYRHNTERILKKNPLYQRFIVTVGRPTLSIRNHSWTGQSHWILYSIGNPWKRKHPACRFLVILTSNRAPIFSLIQFCTFHPVAHRFQLRSPLTDIFDWLLCLRPRAPAFWWLIYKALPRPHSPLPHAAIRQPLPLLLTLETRGGRHKH